MSLWERGVMSIVHGLGYPNPNRSHFKSIELWETGGDGNRQRRVGWITHDLEHSHAVASVDAHGISFGGFGGGAETFSSPSSNWLSMKTTEQFSGRQIESPPKSIEGRNRTYTVLTNNASAQSESLDKIAEKVDNNKFPFRVNGSDGFQFQIGNALNLINKLL